MLLRKSAISLAILSCIAAFGIGCQSVNQVSHESAANTKELVVFVTSNAQQIREKALSFGLNVRTIEGDSAASQLVRAMLNSPSGEYYAVINPALNRYITGGAVSNQVNPVEIENTFRRLKLVSKAGMENMDRLQPSKPGDAKLVVFSDFQCPYCRMMDGYIEQWKKEFGDKLEVELVHFPLPMHDHAFEAAEAAECVKAQDPSKYEAFKEGLFNNQEQLSQYLYGQLALKNGLNQKQFFQCLLTHQERKKVRQDQYFGQYMGVEGTPTMVLNGQAMMGGNPDDIKAKINNIINGSSEATTTSQGPQHG